MLTTIKRTAYIWDCSIEYLQKAVTATTVVFTPSGSLGNVRVLVPLVLLPRDSGTRTKGGGIRLEYLPRKQQSASK